MNKINVYLQRPWKYSDSPYYLYLRQNPPKDVTYINADEFKLIQNKEVMKYQNVLKKRIKKLLRIIPHIPNAHFTFTSKPYDLVHCAHCLSLGSKPWVCDIEFVSQFWAGVKENKHTSLILKLLKSKRCKRIIPWTEWTKQGILEYFPQIKDKMEVVYPAIPERKFKKVKSKDIRLLYISRRFYFKGGLHAIDIMDKLTKKYKNVQGIIVSDTPKEILDKYGKNKKIKFIPLMTQEKLFKEIYPKADIFLYPSYTDTFGFGILEAESFGLPVITADGQSRKELVDNGKTGYVINLKKRFEDSDLNNLKSQELAINEMYKKTESLIKNPKLIKEMSKNCIFLFKDGKFSLKERNKKLIRIYQDTIN